MKLFVIVLKFWSWTFAFQFNFHFAVYFYVLVKMFEWPKNLFSENSWTLKSSMNSLQIHKHIKENWWIRCSFKNRTQYLYQFFLNISYDLETWLLLTSFGLNAIFMEVFVIDVSIFWPIAVQSPITNNGNSKKFHKLHESVLRIKIRIVCSWLSSSSHTIRECEVDLEYWLEPITQFIRWKIAQQKKMRK